VLLSNGAQACNVFWQVGSSATIDTFTQFVGNILALTSITLNTSATLDTGSVLARNGAVTLDTNVIKKATCATPASGNSTQPSTAGGNSTTSSTTGGNSTTTTTSSGGNSTTTTASATPTGTAVLSGPSGPVSGRFPVSVTGHGISTVTFYVDNRRIGTVKAKPGRTKFTVTINPRKQTHRLHRVRARVTFTPKTGRGMTTRRLSYRRTSSVPGGPRFAG
jgi:hypothetical protein